MCVGERADESRVLLFPPASLTVSKPPDDMTAIAFRHPLPRPSVRPADPTGTDVRAQRALQRNALPADLGRHQVQGEGLDRRVRVSVREGSGFLRDSEQQRGQAKAGNVRRRGELLDQVRVRLSRVCPLAPPPSLFRFFFLLVSPRITFAGFHCVVGVPVGVCTDHRPSRSCCVCGATF